MAIKATVAVERYALSWGGERYDFLLRISDSAHVGEGVQMNGLVGTAVGIDELNATIRNFAKDYATMTWGTVFGYDDTVRMLFQFFPPVLLHAVGRLTRLRPLAVPGS